MWTGSVGPLDLQAPRQTITLVAAQGALGDV